MCTCEASAPCLWQLGMNSHKMSVGKFICINTLVQRNVQLSNELSQQEDTVMTSKMCKTITHIFSIVHASNGMHAMSVNQNCSNHEIRCYKAVVEQRGHREGASRWWGGPEGEGTHFAADKLCGSYSVSDCPKTSRNVTWMTEVMIQS